MILKMINTLMILLTYGVYTKSIKCPESCVCSETISQLDLPAGQVVFDGVNLTESGLSENFKTYKMALMDNIETNVIDSKPEKFFCPNEKKKIKYFNGPESLASGSPATSNPDDDPPPKKCAKTSREDVKDISFNNFASKTVNNSKEMRTRRTLKLNMNSYGNASRSEEKKNGLDPHLTPQVYDSLPEANGSSTTESDLGRKWEISPQPEENINTKNGGGIFAHQITCDGVRDLKLLSFHLLANTTRLNIRKTYFRSFRLFCQVLRESPILFDRLTILSLTDNLINQESNEGNSKSDSERSDFDMENRGGGKSRSENGEGFLPFAFLQNPKLRSAKSSETTDSRFGKKFKNVRVLNLVNNTITLLPEDTFRPFQNLEILNLSNNLIKSIGNETFTPLISLFELDLSKNSLSALSAIIFKDLTKLLYLDLSDNFIKNIAPSTFQYLTSLALLNLASNRLSEKEESAAFLLGTGKRLQIVDVSKTGLKQIPGTLERSVRALNLMGNHLLSIRCGDLDSYSLLSYLSLRGNKIAYVEDDALGRLEFLTNLQIGENNLFQVPKSLPNNLRILNLSYNNIQNVTNFDFLNLSLLKELYLSYNQIGIIESKAFENLSQLQILDVSHNPILILPNIYGLTKLIRLNLSYFTNVPESSEIRYKEFPFQSPEKITKLNLESSPLLTSLFLQDTKTLGAFVSLEDLNVRFSNVTTMRKDIFTLLPKIKVLRVEGNPWHCDREILILSEWLKNHGKANAFEEENEINTAHCSTPAYLHKTSLIALNERDFKSSENYEKRERDEEIKVFTKNKNNSKGAGSKSKNSFEISPENTKSLVKFFKRTEIFASRKNLSDAGKVSEKNQLSGGKMELGGTVLLLPNETVESKSDPERFRGGENFHFEERFEPNSTIVDSLLHQRGIEGMSATKMNAHSEDEKNNDFGIPVNNSLEGKTALLNFEGSANGKAEAVTAKDKLSLAKVRSWHLSFFILSSIGLVAMATLTFTSVYFSRTRRNRNYRRHHQDIEVCSISNLGNELW